MRATPCSFTTVCLDKAQKRLAQMPLGKNAMRSASITIIGMLALGNNIALMQGLQNLCLSGSAGKISLRVADQSAGIFLGSGLAPQKGLGPRLLPPPAGKTCLAIPAHFRLAQSSGANKVGSLLIQKLQPGRDTQM